MAKGGSGFGATVKVQGESEYNKALTKIQNNLKVLNSEMKVVTSQYDKNDKSTQNLSQQNEILNKKIAEQKQKVEGLKKVVAEAEAATGKNSATTQKWQTDLNNAQAELNKLERTVSENERAMAESAEATKDNANAVEDFGEEADESGKSALKLGDLIKANLISDAIKSGLTALANGVKAVGSAMTESLTAGAEYADNILTMSVQTGISTENLQKYNAVAELVDVSTETMTNSMAKNIKSMTTASSGSGAMAEAYQKLGVSVTNADGTLRDSETVYWETIDALKNVTDETTRDSIAMQILGKSAQDLNPLIAQGSEGIKALGDEAVKMGAVLSQEALQSLGAVDDEMQKFSSITGATGNLLASAFAPTIATAMSGVNEFAAEINGLIMAVVNGDGQGVEAALNSVGQAVTNMVSNLVNAIPQLMTVASSLIDAFIAVIKNNLPTILKQGVSMLKSLLSGISNTINSLIPVVMEVIELLLTTVLKNLPQIIDMGCKMLVSLVQGISDMLPELIPVAIDSVILVVETLLDNIDLIIDAGIELILSLAEGLMNALPGLIDKIPVIIQKLISALTGNLPKLIEMGIKLTVELGKGLIKAIPQLISQLPQIISAIVSGLGTGVKSMGQVGLNLVKGIWSGISNSLQWIKNKISGWVGDVTAFIKRLFGINSPSRLFRDEIGTNLALGIGEGFGGTMKKVSADMSNAIPTKFDIETTSRIHASSQQADGYNSTVRAFKEALKDVKVYIDRREMGSFVTSTIERAVMA